MSRSLPLKAIFGILELMLKTELVPDAIFAGDSLDSR